jgi:hypothetical protein
VDRLRCFGPANGAGSQDDKSGVAGELKRSGPSSLRVNEPPHSKGWHKSQRYVEEGRRAERATLRVRLEMGREEISARGSDFAEGRRGSLRT